MDLSTQRDNLISRMVKLAKTLPNHDLKNLESIPGFAQTVAIRVLEEFLTLIKSMFLSVLIQDVINLVRLISA